MYEFFITLAHFAARLLTSLWFWVILLIIVVWRVITLIYRNLKLRAIEKIVYSRDFSTDGIFVGETLELIETIRNPTWFPLFSVKMEFFMPSGLVVDDIECQEYTKVTSIFNIPPFSTVKKYHTVKANKRDHYRLFNSEIKYRSYEYNYDCPTFFYAYPNQYDANASFPPDVYHAGEAVANRKYIEDPFFLSGIRPYRPGDLMRSINFKASVRYFSGGMRQLMCNDYDSSRNFDSMIVLDLTSNSGIAVDSVEQVEVGLRYACYLFCEAIKNGGKVGFSANCATDNSPYILVPCENSNLHTKHILERFAEISPYARRDYSISALLQKLSLQLPKGTDIYLITTLVNDKTAEMLYTLQHMGKNVQVITLG